MMPDPSKITAVLSGILAAALIQTRPAWAQVKPDLPSGSLVRIQSAHAKDLAAGKFLVASRDLPDPNFSQTVVLLIQYDEQGAVGLILNRRTKILLSEALPDLKGIKGRSDAVYLGGPVGPTSALALIRSQNKPVDARLILTEVYLTASRAALEKNLVSGSPRSVHVYVGYAGWTAEQLRREVALGAWFIFPGDAATVFDANPESIWSRWILKTEGQIASAPVRYTGCQLGFVAAARPFAPSRGGAPWGGSG